MIGAVTVVVLIVLVVGSNVLGDRPPWAPQFTRAPGSDGGDLDAAKAAQDFLRLVADSRRNAETAPLPCFWVTDEGGVLNPCRDELQRRWGELVSVERAGTRLTVNSVTSYTRTVAVVTEADISPRIDGSLSVTLERGGSGEAGWRVRKLNDRALPR